MFSTVLASVLGPLTDGVWAAAGQWLCRGPELRKLNLCPHPQKEGSHDNQHTQVRWGLKDIPCVKPLVESGHEGKTPRHL